MKRHPDLRKLPRAVIVFIRCRIRRYQTKRYAAGITAMLVLLLTACTFTLPAGKNIMDKDHATAAPITVSAAEAEPDSTTAENRNTQYKAAREEYATSHKEMIPEENKAPDTAGEDIREPLAAAPVPLADIYAEPGSIAVFRCYYPDAEDYTWEICDENGRWIPAEAEDTAISTDELYRKISTFMVTVTDKGQKELMVRCSIKNPAGTAITEKAALHILPEITSVSAEDYTAEAGAYISAREIPVQASFADGSKDTVTGLGGLYFLEKEESTEQDTAASGSRTEIITTVITAHDYMYLSGEKEVILRYQGNDGSTDIPVRLIGKDSTAPDITGLVIDDFEISPTDQPVTVHVAISAEDNVTAYPDLEYAFLPEGEEPQEASWTDQSSFDADISKNGKWTAYCRDESGNIAKEEKELIVVDNKAPVVRLSLESDTWCSENKILVDARDGLSVEYCYSCAQTGEDSGWITESEHVVTQNGTWNVRVRDAVGNMTEEEITIENIDNQAPVIRAITEKTEIEEENNNQ